MANLYFYHPASNDVTRYSGGCSFNEFVEQETAHNSFWCGDRTDGAVEIYANGREMMTLTDVTEEQAVILFATLLGLREAARE